MVSVKLEIMAQLESSDDPERIPPMAVVRCSRGGKTRALYEIANTMKNDKNEDIMEAAKDHWGGPVAVIYVTFNDNSSVETWEQLDPLQALLQRIAFVASRERNDDEIKLEAYDASQREQNTAYR
jgi:hypothetical protein